MVGKTIIDILLYYKFSVFHTSKKAIQANGAQRQRYHMSTQYTIQQITLV